MIGGALVRSLIAAPGVARDVWRDLREPYSHRCPVCHERVGPDLGLHCRTEHTPAELAAHYRKAHV